MYGQMVNVAAHINNLAGAAEVLVSQEVFDQISTELKNKFSFAGPELFKGISSIVDLFTSGPVKESDPSGSRTLPDTYEEWTLDEFPRGEAFRLMAQRDGEDERETIVQDQPVLIGKSKQCDLSFPDDPYLSRRHALVAIAHGVPWIFDNESKAGLYVEDESISPGRKLWVDRRGPIRPGQKIRLSSIGLTVQPLDVRDLTPGAEGPSRAPTKA